MSEPDAAETQDYREVRARELVLQPAQLDGRRIVLTDYIDGGRKAVDTPELLTLGLSTAASPPGVAKLLGSLGKRLVRARLRGVFRAERLGPPGLRTLEVHAIEVLPEPPYQRVTWAEVARDPEKYDRARIEYVGQYASQFESSRLDGVWLAFSPYATQRGEARPPRTPGGKWEVKVQVRGVLHTQPGGYGHLGGSLWLLRADEIEYLP